MFDCSTFLEEYSSFRDGLLAEAEEQRFEAHLEACDSCRRYDRLISVGVERYRGCSAPPLSEDFQLRLQHRIFHLEDEQRERPRNGSGAQAALTLALAATIAAIAWVPVARVQPTELRLPSVAARPPLPPAPADPSRFVPGFASDADVVPSPDVWSGWGAFAGESETSRRTTFGGPDFRVRQVLQH